jgi:hypothetical protein
VFTFEAGDVTLVRLEIAEIADGTREARTFSQVAGGVPVSLYSVPFQSKIDHRAQKQCGSQRIFSGERIGGGLQDFVVIAVQLLSAP